MFVTQMKMLVVMLGMEGLVSGHGVAPCTGPGMPLLLVTHPLVGDPLATHQHRAATVVGQPKHAEFITIFHKLLLYKNSFTHLSRVPLVLMFIQNAASPLLTGTLIPVLGKAVAPPAATLSR